jgi:N-methylhydantoinase A
MTRYGVDVGGTFTDIVSVDRHGGIGVGKVRSVRGGIAEAVWPALRHDRGTEAATLTHGTTVATNALLERSGGRTVLVMTAGFEDLLWLRRQDRVALYELSDDHPAPVVDPSDVVGVAERIGSSGVVRSLEPNEIRRVVQSVVTRSPEAVAIALLFSFQDPRHERALAEALRQALPGIPVAASHEVLPVFREYERTSTTAVEAYLRPLVSGYLERMERRARDEGLHDLRIMASNGGALSAAQARVRAGALALSGPAGGVEGARLLSEQFGVRDLLTLDMGGTSADASVVLDGQPLTQTSAVVGGVPLALPHVLIETVGAGGGSVAWVDRGGALRVGPRSAGALPGPACYGLGGTEPTVTDAALVLGWLDPDRALADGLSLDRSAAVAAVGAVAANADLALERCAEGIIEVANATMVRALRRVSVERGIDPRHLALVPFGGAGPMFACRMADSLGMTRAIVPPYAGVLSALGLASAPARIEFTGSLHLSASAATVSILDGAFAEMERAGRGAMADARLERFAECRYPGQGYELLVPGDGDGGRIAQGFHGVHRERYGHADESREVEIVNLRLTVTRDAEPLRLAGACGTMAPVHGAQRAWLPDLAPQVTVTGPFMLDASDCTVRVEAGWTGTINDSGGVILERQ